MLNKYKNIQSETETRDRCSPAIQVPVDIKKSKGKLITIIEEKFARNMSTLDALVLASEIKRNENKINNLKNAATIVRVKPVSVNAAGVTGNPAVAIQRSFSEVVIRRE